MESPHEIPKPGGWEWGLSSTSWYRFSELGGPWHPPFLRRPPQNSHSPGAGPLLSPLRLVPSHRQMARLDPNPGSPGLFYTKTTPQYPAVLHPFKPAGLCFCWPLCLEHHLWLLPGNLSLLPEKTCSEPWGGFCLHLHHHRHISHCQIPIQCLPILSCSALQKQIPRFTTPGLLTPG